MTSPRAYTTSAVRCGRAVCPPRPVRRTVTWSADPVIPPTLSPTRPTTSRGSQCRAKIRSTPSSAAGGDHVRGADAHDLLGRLEHQPYVAGDQSLAGEVGEHETGAEDARGVHVVTARVAHTGHGRPVGHVLLVGQRQRVDVGAERDRAGRPVGAELVSGRPRCRTAGPCRSGAARGASPAAASRSASSRVVRTSEPPSSGCAWRSRRRATSSSSYGLAARSISSTVSGKSAGARGGRSRLDQGYGSGGRRCSRPTASAAASAGSRPRGQVGPGDRHRDVRLDRETRVAGCPLPVAGAHARPSSAPAARPGRGSPRRPRSSVRRPSPRRRTPRRSPARCRSPGSRQPRTSRGR